jgi:hypothetical protein
MTVTKEKRKRLPGKPASKMTVAELEALSGFFHKANVPTRPLTVKDRADLARAARKNPGRPKVGEGAERVLVTIEGGLLKRADAYCKAKNLKRSELIAIGLQRAMSA